MFSAPGAFPRFCASVCVCADLKEKVILLFFHTKSDSGVYIGSEKKDLHAGRGEHMYAVYIEGV